MVCRPGLPSLTALAARLCVGGLPLLAVACTENSPVASLLAPPKVVRGAMPDRLPPVQPKQPPGLIKPAVAQVKAPPATLPPVIEKKLPPVEEKKAPVVEEKKTPPAEPKKAEQLPAPRSSSVIAKPAEGPAVVAAEHKTLPISLDTVLRLAEDQNLQVGQARLRVDEAQAQYELACRSWMPNVFLGAGYFRHEGGIQLQQGQNIHSSTGSMLSGLDVQSTMDLREYAYQKVNAQRKEWQQRAEVSRLTSETLLDAANTYVDLLTAQTGRAIVLEIEKDLNSLLDRANKLAETEPGARVEVSRIRAEIEGRRQNARHLERQAAGASAKLVYLLGLEPCTELVACDQTLAPYNLVDVTPSCCELVQLAITHGPGINELARLVAIIDDAIAQSKGCGQYLPIFEMRMIEGAFGAAPGGGLSWDNRWDGYLQMRWNLTDLCNKCEKRRIADAQRQQAHLAFEDLKAKLAAGVQEARETILGGSEEIRSGIEQVRYAQDARELSRKRLDGNVPGATPSEVLLSLQSVGLAQINYVTAIRDYDKAQLRMLILTGGAHGAALPPAVCVDEHK